MTLVEEGIVGGPDARTPQGDAELGARSADRDADRAVAVERRGDDAVSSPRAGDGTSVQLSSSRCAAASMLPSFIARCPTNCSTDER